MSISTTIEARAISVLLSGFRASARTMFGRMVIRDFGSLRGGVGIRDLALGLALALGRARKPCLALTKQAW